MNAVWQQTYISIVYVVLSMRVPENNGLPVCCHQTAHKSHIRKLRKAKLTVVSVKVTLIGQFINKDENKSQCERFSF